MSRDLSTWEIFMTINASKKFINMIGRIIYYILKLYWLVFKPMTFGVKCVVECDGKILMIKNRDIYKLIR